MSMLDFLVDEYMDSTVANLSEMDLSSLCIRISALCKGVKTEADGKSDDPTRTVEKTAHPNHQDESLGPISAIEMVLRTFIGNPEQFFAKLVFSSGRASDFFLSHLEQIYDNIRLRRHQPQPRDLATCFLSPRGSHYIWSYHTSCGLSFNFYICCLDASSHQYSDFFESADEKYLAQDLCAHLGTMS